MTDEDLTALRVLAKAATPGPRPAANAIFRAAATPQAIAALLDEIERLRAEVARLSAPDMFWDGSCPDTPYLSAQDVLDDADAGQLIVEVQQAHRLPSQFVVEVTGDDDELHTMEFPTRESAEAWLDTRQKDATP